MEAGFLGSAFPWVVAAHVIFVVFLMAGLFMIPRFFVYHQQCPVGSAEDRLWIEREGRLKRIILNPSIIVTWVLGLALAINTGAFSDGWFHVKLLLVVLLTGYHHWVTRYATKLARGERTISEKALRMLNEVPGMLAAAIIVTVIVFGPRFGSFYA